MKKLNLYAFCILYDHLHLLLKPGRECNVSKVMHFLKKNVAYNVNKIMGYNVFEPKPVGEFAQIRLQFDEGLNDLKKQFLKKYAHNQSTIPQFRWQKSFYDHIIRDENDFQNHYNYTIYDFQKHNLPINWKYTSLNFHDLVDNF